MSRSTVGYRSPPIPGVQTVVKDQGDTAPDREKEVALPPGSATPNSPSSGGGGNGREIPRPEYNTPDNDIDKRPRTLPTPGDEYGHPTKYDYNHVTRRSMTADYWVGIDDGSAEGDKTAYQREWRPGKRQQKSRGRTRTKRRLTYRKNRNKERMRARRNYRKVRNNPRFKALRKHRRTNPNQHRRRRASAEAVASLFQAAQVELPSPVLVAALYLEGWEAPKEIYPIERQRKQLPQDRLESKREYRRNRSKKNRDMLKRYHQFCKKNPRCRRKREMYRKYPERFERRSPQQKREASVLTTPEIYFAFGPDLMPGVVHNISPMTGMVTFNIQQKDQDHLRSMSFLPFIHTVVFLSDDDIDAFFELSDLELGEEAFEDFSEADLRECARISQVDIDSDEFSDACSELVGEPDVGAMTPDQLSVVNSELVLGILAHGNMDRETEEEEEFDEHLYYGDVDLEPDANKTATGTGITFQYEQKAPNDTKQYPEKGVRSLPTGPTNWEYVDTDDDGGATLEREDDNVPPATSKVVPDGQYVKAAATMDELATKTSRDIHSRARKVAIRLRRADPRNGMWTFQARGSNENYTVRLKGMRKGNIKDLKKAQVQVSCTCPFFRYQGPEHWAKSHGFLYGRPRGTAEAPSEKDPRGQHWVCKHVLAALNLARKYRFGSEGEWALEGDIVPDLPDARRVASRFLDAARPVPRFELEGPAPGHR